MQVGDIVKHKTNKALVRGTVKEIAKSGVRARVVWDRKDNPWLTWGLNAYYKFDSLEPI